MLWRLWDSHGREAAEAGGASAVPIRQLRQRDRTQLPAPHHPCLDNLGCVVFFFLENAAQVSAMIVRLLPADDVAFQALEGGVECRRHARALREGG